MQIKSVGGRVTKRAVDVLALPVIRGSVSDELGEIDEALDGRLLSEAAVRVGDPAKRGRVFAYQTHGALPASLVVLVGMGSPSASGEVPDVCWRRFAGRAVREARRARAKSVGLCVGSAVDPGRAVAAVSEGAGLASYRIVGWKSDLPTEYPQSVSILGAGTSRATVAAEEEGRILAEATCFARDLINAPAAECTPAHLGQVAKRLARETNLTAKVHGPTELKKLGMGAILGVGQGSRNPPRLIELMYRAPGRRKKRPHVTLVGKGITFDSGGLSLKPARSMEIQKRDMAGGAAVLGAMKAIAQLRPDIDVRGLVPSAENMPGGNSYRPGDVLRTWSGKTVEVLNTDAEGRLVLSDALAWGAKGVGGQAPLWMVDLATLTGAVTVALGRRIAGVMGTDPGLVQELIAAGETTGEPMWELPLVEEYRPGLDSLVADIKNTGDGTAGSIYGGLFLREFVGGVPWAHLDIAAVAYAEKEDPISPRGAVGWGVRALAELVRRAARSS